MVEEVGRRAFTSPGIPSFRSSSAPYAYIGDISFNHITTSLVIPIVLTMTTAW